MDGFLLLYGMRWISQTFKAILVTGGTKGGEALLLSSASIWAAPLNAGKTGTRYFNSVFLHWSSFPRYPNLPGWPMHSSEDMGTVSAVGLSGTAAVPASYPALPPSPSPSPANASVLHSFAGARWHLMQQLLCGLTKHMGIFTASGAAGPLGWRSELPSCLPKVLPLPGDSYQCVVYEQVLRFPTSPIPKGE